MSFENSVEIKEAVQHAQWKPTLPKLYENIILEFESRFYDRKSPEANNEAKLLSPDKIKFPKNFKFKMLAVGNIQFDDIQGYWKKIKLN